jgi:hypothetical protein
MCLYIFCLFSLMDLNWKRFSEGIVFVQQLECHVKFTFFGTLAVLVFSSSFCGRWISNPRVPDSDCVWGRWCSALLLKFYNSRHLRLCWSSRLPTISWFLFVSVVVIGRGWNVSVGLVRICYTTVTVGAGSCVFPALTPLGARWRSG